MDLNKNIEKHTDTILNNYHIEPYFDESSEKVFYTADGIITFNLDEMLYEKNGGRAKFGLSERFNEFKNHKQAHYFNDLKYLKEVKELKEKDFNGYKLNDKDISIIMYLKNPDFKEKYGLFLRNSFDKGIKKKNSKLTVRLELNKRINNMTALVEGIGVETGIKPKLIDGEKSNFIYLKFKTSNQLLKADTNMTIEKLENYANKDLIAIGMTEEGELLLENPKLTDAFQWGEFGGSGSGKSKLLTMNVVNLALLKIKLPNGETIPLYSNMFFGSLKASEDFYPLGWEDLGMFITEDVMEIYFMLKEVMAISEHRSKLFKEHKVSNISQYNEKFPNNPMQKILVVFDEFRNTLNSAQSITVVENGNKFRLNVLLETYLADINRLTRTRGINTIVLNQGFSKSDDELGKPIANSINTKFLGYADTSVWNYADKTGEISKIYDNMENTVGLFFADIKLNIHGENADEIRQEKISGYTKVQAHFLPTSEAKKLNVTFESNEKYGNKIRYLANKEKFGEDYQESETVVEEDIILENNNIENTIKDEKDKERNESDIMEFLLD